MNYTIITAPTPTAERVHQQLVTKLPESTSDGRPVVFAVGGDGTMLRAIRETWRDEPIYVGLSAGHLGFLQAFEVEQLDDVLQALTLAEPQTVTASLLKVSTESGKALGYAFNDVSVERSGPRASRFHLEIDAAPGSFIGDGVIFATAFGSTAYSLAAGGPVIDTRASDVMVVTPNNPHVSSQYSSLQRPHVLQRGRRVLVRVSPEDSAERPAQVVLDGLTITDNLMGSITVEMSDQTVAFLELEADSFHTRLETKRLGRS